MQARVVSSNGDDAFNALVYEQPDNRILDYMQNTISYAADKIIDGSSYLIDNAAAMYNRFNSSAVINAAKALVSNSDSHLNPNVILSYTEDNIYNATPIMQQYIMAQPDMWNLDNRQMCSSYDGQYYNVDPYASNVEEHTRYQEVMDGVVQFDDDNSGYFETYSSSTIERLHTIDQLSILSTWDSVKNLMADDIDPSSPDGDEL